VREMLEGWRNQQLCRNLAHDTITDRIRLVERFLAYTNEFPWTWTPALLSVGWLVRCSHSWTTPRTNTRHFRYSKQRCGHRPGDKLFRKSNGPRKELACCRSFEKSTVGREYGRIEYGGLPVNRFHQMNQRPSVGARSGSPPRGGETCCLSWSLGLRGARVRRRPALRGQEDRRTRRLNPEGDNNNGAHIHR
jgi:hypothetical protein